MAEQGQAMRGLVGEVKAPTGPGPEGKEVLGPRDLAGSAVRRSWGVEFGTFWR